MHEAADAVEAFRSFAPGGGDFARLPCEAAGVVGDKLAQNGIGRIEVHRLGQAQFAGEALLQHAPETFDAAFGLRTSGGDESDAELLQRATELRGLAFSSELFLDGPAVVIADEDAAVISVESQRHAEAPQQLAKQAEIAKGGLRGEELCGQDFAGGVVLHAQSGEPWAAAFQPVVRAAVELHEFAEPRGTQASLAMRGSTAFSRRTETVLAQQTAQRFAAQRKALALQQLLAEMVVVETCVGAARQLYDPLADGVGQAPVAGPAAVGVRSSRCARGLPELRARRWRFREAAVRSGGCSRR